MKAKTFDLRVVLFLIIGLYPLVRFDWSTKIVALFTIATIFISIRKREWNFSKKRIQSFVILTGYYFFLSLTILFSSNSDESIARIVQLTPLLIAPLLLSFSGFKLNSTQRNIGLFSFCCINLVYAILVFGEFILSAKGEKFGYKDFLLDYDKFQYIINHLNESNSLFFHKPYFSMGFAICAIFSLDKVISLKRMDFWRIIYFLLFTLFTLLLFYAFSFPNVLAFIICTIVLFYLKLKRTVFLSFFFISIIAIGLLFSYKMNDKDVQRGVNFVKSIVSDKEYEINDTRIEIYKSFKKIYQKSTTQEIFFGLGIGDVQDHLNREYDLRLKNNKYENKLFFSEEFNNQYWYKNNLFVNANKGDSPIDSIENSDLISINSGLKKQSHNLSILVEVDTPKVYTFSIYVKTLDQENVILRLGDIKQVAIFNILKGKLLKKGKNIDANITHVKDGWYRCSITTNLREKGLALFGFSNENEEYVFKSNSNSSLFLWGAQLQEGPLTNYSVNKNAQLFQARKEKLNTHNTYMYIFMASGIIGIILFISTLIFLFFKSIKPLDILKISFLIILSLNFVTENILYRHWGLMFFFYMLILLYSNSSDEENLIE